MCVSVYYLYTRSTQEVDMPTFCIFMVYVIQLAGKFSRTLYIQKVYCVQIVYSLCMLYNWLELFRVHFVYKKCTVYKLYTPCVWYTTGWNIFAYTLYTKNVLCTNCILLVYDIQLAGTFSRTLCIQKVCWPPCLYLMSIFYSDFYTLTTLVPCNYKENARLRR